MKKKIRIEEKKLVNLIKQVVLEQSDITMDRRVGIESRNMRALGLNPSDPYDIQNYRESVYGEPPTIHDILQFTAAGLFPFVPWLSVALELTDAAIYYNENDKRGAGLSLLWALLPFGIEYFPGVKQLGKKGFDILTRKLGKQGAKYTQQEIKALTELNNKTKLNKNLDIAIKKVAQKASQKTAEKGAKNTLKKIGQFGLQWVGVPVGVNLAYDSAYDYATSGNIQTTVENDGYAWDEVKRSLVVVVPMKTILN